MVVVEVSNVPNNSMDDQLLVELEGCEPPKDKILKQQATNPKHMRLNFSNSQFYPISHITKDNAMKFSHSNDGKVDGLVDSSEQQHEQLSASSVVLDKGSQKVEVLTGKVESHRSESVAVKVHNPKRSVPEGDHVFPVGMLCGHALFRGITHMTWKPLIILRMTFPVIKMEAIMTLQHLILGDVPWTPS